MINNPADKDNSLFPASFIYDKATLNDTSGIYADCSRKFQGIPGIESTPGRRFFTVFYTGTSSEGDGNYLLLHTSDDGEHFEVFAAVVPPAENTRCYDPCLWCSPDGFLRLYWAQSCGYYDGRCGVWYAVCENPDDDEPRFSNPRRIANGIMMNKPTVLSDGAWLLPCAVWGVCESDLNYLPNERYSNVYRSDDSGKTYVLYGHSDCDDRGFDEHMIYERKDGSLVMLVRTNYGIGEAFSDDGGRSWYGEHDSGLGGPCSRFCVRRLASGRLLLINHYRFKGRNNLTAKLSEDDGLTWREGLLLDGRNDVSYPDMTQTADGYLHIIYDRNRTTDREILLARICEDDILNGRLVGKKSALGIIVNKAYG